MPHEIGQVLKTYRNKEKITVKEISDILTQKGFKASESTIYSWENGNSQPTPGALLAMCSAYKIENILEAFGYDGYNEDGSIRLNMYEEDLVEKYRVLDTHGKRIVDMVLDEEYSRCENAASAHLTLAAAHEIPESSDEDSHFDDEIMQDDNF